MSGSPDPAVPAPDAAVPPADDPPIRVNPPGRWVTTPDGERIYLLDPPRPAAAPAPVSVAPTPDPEERRRELETELRQLDAQSGRNWGEQK